MWNHFDELYEQLPWTGLWPGVVECRELGWYAVLQPGKGWVSCAKNTPGASEDLNRLAVLAKWNTDAKRYERRA